MTRDRAGLLRRGGKLRQDVGRRELRVRPRVPLRRRGGEALLRRERMDGHDRDGVVELHDLGHAAHRLRLRIIDRHELSTEGRRLGHDRELHSRQPRIDAELRAAVDLARNVEAVMRRADQLEVRGILEGDVRRHRKLRRGIDQLAVAELAAAGRMHDNSHLRLACGRIDVPALRGRRHEHDACRRAGLAQRDVGAANGGRTARQLSTNERIRIDLVIGRRVLNCNLVDIHLELFGDQHR